MLGASFYSITADLILVVHFGFVLFVVLGLGAIWMGGWRKWSCVRKRSFRFAHLGAMGVVVLESGLGVTCPLTTWENGLRGMAGQQGYGESFMEHWIHRWMFIDLPPAVFTAVYVVFFLGITLSFIVVRVAPRAGRKSSINRNTGAASGSRPDR